ncbi:uncharacterized protein HD556DRAFT_1238518 [Suillus plorans]|uniref:U4/U6 snRNA-associated-splicing factor PRP24 n=1 Tax=Suillus plorans TaxID=116603 RepID=A0A9P7DHD2_9AGAM|nr:uncharacterized protein HD556DRAFT_1238518 [Suillus plorans]KAG1792920.1 hypothetical protein HD556DRAFT_1238518 [Suillus plorans]
MDESVALDALADTLTRLSTNSYSVDLHVQHIRLAKSMEDKDQILVALEMATNYIATPDDVWLPLIDAKTAANDINTPEGALEVLGVYSKAEQDYMSFSILQKHLEFLADRHEHFSGLEVEPDSLGELFSDDWTRELMSIVVSKGAGDIAQSHILWDQYYNWELEILEKASMDKKPLLVNVIENILLARLQQPHAKHQDTYQSYSSFTTAHKPPSEYESLLISASKLRSRAVKEYEKREASEMVLAAAGYSLDAYATYIAAERRRRDPDYFILCGLYERGLAEASRRQFAGELGAERATQMFWVGYIDFVNSQGQSAEFWQRATRSAPGSGEVWARYIRFLEREQESEASTDEMDASQNEDIEAAYARALSTTLFSRGRKSDPEVDADQIVPLVLARAGAAKRAVEAGHDDGDSLTTLIKVVEDGIAMVRQASSSGDPRFRLEKFLSEFYLSLADVPDAAVQLWASTAAHYKSSWAAWVAYTDVLIRTYHHDLARKNFQDMSTKNLDYPEALWDAWHNFEHAHGSLSSLEEAIYKITQARAQLETRRAREAEKAYAAAAAQYAEQQSASMPTVPATGATQDSIPIASETMDVDFPAPADTKGKRKAEEEPLVTETSGGKKPRLETPPVSLKRDRENCTVFVADLPSEATEADLKALFKDASCGDIRDIKFTRMPETLVATVEFHDRDSVPAALTKDKKRIHETEIGVHLAWRSTLYVTNFPEKFDDASIRDLFGQYGLIFDVRWPSKKFKATRRFCYLQYTSPPSAERALELHGRELEPDRAISVLISNPERKKERSDADANERELYVAGLSKFATKEDLRKVFETYGPIKEIRLAEDKSGQSKGFAFVDFESETDARAALAANNYELKNRRIAVTFTDSRVRAKNKERTAETGLGRRADARNRSVRIRNIPSGTQEGLLHQLLEKHFLVKRTEVFTALNEAVVELENPAEAGKLLLRTEPIILGENVLQFSEEQAGPSHGQPAAPPPATGGMFVPRATGSRPRAGLGRARKPGLGATQASSSSSAQPPEQKGKKGQDDFRKMLG